MDPETGSGRMAEFDPDRVFGILGNEIRVEILQRLWEAYDPFGTTGGLAFSELYDAVDVEDSGQFNYHLDRLRELYVHKSGGRYRLTAVGLRLVQSVIAGAGRELDPEPTEVDATCRLCGAPIEFVYDGLRVYFVCTECEGQFDDDQYPDGTLWGETIPPAGVLDRTPKELVAAVSFLDWTHKAMLTGSICPRCTGVLERTVEVCETHDSSGGPCSECGFTESVRVNWLCTVCKYHGVGAPTAVVKNHPAVIAFSYDHGIDFGYPYTTSEFGETHEEEAVRREMDSAVEVRSTDPVRLRVRIGYYGDAIALTSTKTWRFVGSTTITGAECWCVIPVFGIFER